MNLKEANHVLHFLTSKSDDMAVVKSQFWLDQHGAFFKVDLQVFGVRRVFLLETTVNGKTNTLTMHDNWECRGLGHGYMSHGSWEGLFGLFIQEVKNGIIKLE